MPKVSLHIDPQTMAEANASVSRNLAVPETAVKRGDTARWTEELEITAASIAPSERKEGTMTVVVRSQVVVDGDPANVNSGRPFTMYFDITPAAFRNPSHPSYKGNNMNMGRLNGLLRSLDYELGEGGDTIDYGDFFSAEDGEQPAVVGRRVVAMIRQYVYQGKERQQADEFLPAAGA